MNTLFAFLLAAQAMPLIPENCPKLPAEEQLSIMATSRYSGVIKAEILGVKHKEGGARLKVNIVATLRGETPKKKHLFINDPSPKVNPYTKGQKFIFLIVDPIVFDRIPDGTIAGVDPCRVLTWDRESQILAALDAQAAEEERLKQLTASFDKLINDKKHEEAQIALEKALDENPKNLKAIRMPVSMMNYELMNLSEGPQGKTYAPLWARNLKLQIRILPYDFLAYSRLMKIQEKKEAQESMKAYCKALETAPMNGSRAMALKATQTDLLMKSLIKDGQINCPKN